MREYRRGPEAELSRKEIEVGLPDIDSNKKDEALETVPQNSSVRELTNEIQGLLRVDNQSERLKAILDKVFEICNTVQRSQFATPEELNISYGDSALKQEVCDAGGFTDFFAREIRESIIVPFLENSQTKKVKGQLTVNEVGGLIQSIVNSLEWNHELDDLPEVLDKSDEALKTLSKKYRDDLRAKFNIQRYLRDYAALRGKDAVAYLLQQLEILPHDDTTMAVATALRDFTGTSSLPELSRRLYASRNPEAYAKELDQRGNLRRVDAVTEAQIAQAKYSQALKIVETEPSAVHENAFTYLGNAYEIQGETPQITAVQRICVDDKLGLFGKGGNLLGYAALPDTPKDSAITPITFRPIDASQVMFHEADDTFELHNFLRDYVSSAKEILQETGIRLADFTLREQFWFCKMWQNADERARLKIKRLNARDGASAMRVFVVAEVDECLPDRILEIFEIAESHETTLINLWFAFNEVANRAAEIAVASMAAENAEVPSKEVIVEALMVRAKDILSSAAEKMSKKEELPDKIAFDARKELEKETEQMRLSSGLVRRTAEMLRSRRAGSTSLSEYAETQEFLAGETDVKSKALFMRALASRAELKPIPEIHWRVDRGSEEYARRFGINLMPLLTELNQGQRKKNLVEFGPGSGKNKEERARVGLQEKYNDVGIADTLYYPLNRLVEEVIDWDKLEKQIKHGLLDEERHLLSEAIAKIVMISEGETARDKFSYDREAITNITRDPNNLKYLLRRKIRGLAETKVVPSTISSRDENGEVFYPKKQINLTLSAITIKKPSGWIPPINHPWRTQFLITKKQSLAMKAK